MSSDETIVNFSIEFYKDSNRVLHMYVATDTSSGCDYICENGVEDAKKHMLEYLGLYFPKED